MGVINDMKYCAVLLFSLVNIVLMPAGPCAVKAIQLSGLAQGTTWHATYYAADSLVTKKQIDSILDVIDSSLSLYKPYSKIVAFNKSAKGIKIDDHFRKVVEKSLDTYKQTNGLFDITVGPLTEAWGFGARANAGIPEKSLIVGLLPCIGSKYIRLQHDSLIKTKPCVKIDVNGIAQGYSVDVLADFFEKKGISDYIIELGGELRIKGKKPPDEIPFRVGIESPSDDDFNLPPMQKILNLNSGAITTSGNYRKFHESRGKRFSHIINPITGFSANNEMISVTVYAKDAVTADAYDNALMLMGVERAMKFVESRKELGAFFIYKRSDGKLADTATSRFLQIINNPDTLVKNQ